MPTVLRIGRYRFHFYSSDRSEPPHMHVTAGADNAKFWLNPVRLASNHGFSAAELNEIRDILVENHARLLEAWNEYFRN